MKTIWNWFRKKLGIIDVEKILVCQHKAIGRIENKIRMRKQPQRYDEVERQRKRRRKSA